jgi:hypothetical protein
MAQQNGKPLIIFFHIGKNGGTTLWAVLQRLYGKGRVLRVLEDDQGGQYNVYRQVEHILRETPHKYDVIGGHLGRIGVHEALNTRPYTYITLLRNPISRTISLFFYAKRAAHHWRYERMNEIEDLKAGLLQLPANHQVRCLADLPKGTDVTEADLETAKRNIDQKFAAVGLTERFDESLILFQQALGWPTPYYFKVKNAAQERARVPDDILSLIKERNALDMALIEWMNQRMDAQIAAQGESFQSGLRALQRTNRVQGWRHQFHELRGKLLGSEKN